MILMQNDSTINTLEENKNTFFKSALVGANDKVMSFGIMSPENPMGEALSKEENAARRRDFESRLKTARYDFIRIKGKYNGTEEKSYFIININKKDLDYYGHEFNQESIVYAEKKDLKTANNHWMYFYYLSKEKDEKSPYEIQKAKSRVVDMTSKADMFSILKSYKFQIPFFEEVLKEANTLLKEKYFYIEENTLIEGIIRNIEETGYTPKHRWINRCFLYETPERKKADEEELKIAIDKLNKV